jgi:integrase family protein with SAM-like domain
MMPPIFVGPLLQTFFTEYLVAQKRLSLQTIASYRDTFRLLLQFVHRKTGIEPVALPITTLDADRVLAFLDGLEKDRHNAITSRNLRLTAIRSFFRMVALREPAIVGLATRILAIPMKRTDTKVRDYVTREEMDALLASLDRTEWCGRRNYALLLTMYGCTRLRDHRVAPTGRHLRVHQLCPVAGERAQGTRDPALAQDRTDPKGMVSRNGRGRRGGGVSECSSRPIDAVRGPPLAAQGCGDRLSALSHPQEQTCLAPSPGQPVHREGVPEGMECRSALTRRLRRRRPRRRDPRSV